MKSCIQFAYRKALLTIAELKMNKRSFWLLHALLFVLPTITYSASPDTTNKTKSVPVIVSEVKVDQFVDRVEALGTLKAIESVAVTANVTETVSAIHFDDGQRVEAGQVLVELTSAEERALLKEARVREAEATRQ